MVRLREILALSLLSSLSGYAVAAAAPADAEADNAAGPAAPASEPGGGEKLEEVVVTAGRGRVHTQIYSLTTNTWRRGPPSGHLYLPAAVQYLDTVVVAGGYSSKGPASAVYMYDPVNGEWAPRSRMAAPNFGIAGTLVPDGYVACVQQQQGQG